MAWVSLGKYKTLDEVGDVIIDRTRQRLYGIENKNTADTVSEVSNLKDKVVTALNKENIEGFKNQLQQKGIQGEPLETAVADFVKFLKKQNKKSGENASCSEPAASKNNVGDKDDDNG
jgi:hypothetical protein